MGVILNREFLQARCPSSHPANNIEITVVLRALCVWCFCSKVKQIDTELHIATTTLKSLELSESKVSILQSDHFSGKLENLEISGN